MDKQDKHLKELLRQADRIVECDDFYHESVIEEQLDDDSLDDEESAFMMGYLAS